MRLPSILVSALSPLAVLPATAAAADGECTSSRLMVVLDKSSSMLGPVNEPADLTPKWDIAAEAIGLVAGAYEDSVEIGLNVFPEQPEGEDVGGECNPGTVIVEPAFRSADAIVSALVQAPPEFNNYTPMAQTLERVAATPSLTDPGADHYVVLITDGWQWCYNEAFPKGYDPSTRFKPVEAVEKLKAAGITTYVVGFGGAVDAETLNMAAVVAGTDRSGCDPTGNTPESPDPCYYQADSSAELLSALMDVAGQIPAEETCNGMDDDCNGSVDDVVARECTTACGSGVEMCSAGEWGDCDAPAPAEEVCNSVDDDCDGTVDELCGGEEPTEELPDSGCGCRADGSASRATAWLLVLLLASALLRRRRGRTS